MGRTDRHIVEYACDQCGTSVVTYDDASQPLDGDEWPLTPRGWFSMLDWRPERAESVDLCSAKCLREWAGKQGGSDGSG